MNFNIKQIVSLGSANANQGEGGSIPGAKYLGTVTNGDTAFPTPTNDGDYVKPSSTSTFPFTIEGITFTTKLDIARWDSPNNRWILDPGAIEDTAEMPVSNKLTESTSGDATTQQEINIENANSIKGIRFDFTNSQEWNISHLLDRKPIVRCFDSNDSEIYGKVNYPTSNNAKVIFGIAVTGYAIVN